MFILRGVTLVPVPSSYQSDPAHQALVSMLMGASTYMNAVVVLETHPDKWLAADILTGAKWAQRFLLSTTALAQSKEVREQRLAARGQRAFWQVLTGMKRHVGRHAALPLTDGALQEAANAMARWRTYVEAYWEASPEATARGLLRQASFPVSRSHRSALLTTLRRPRVRKADVVLALVSWETGVPIRRLRHSAQPVADLIYR